MYVKTDSKVVTYKKSDDTFWTLFLILLLHDFLGKDISE